ncbi:hypothetical protein EBB59_04765 [Lysobacter pythonis]|uniref:Lipoprotein n=1 Tax=Solilutibacter pythonis TaxID=2483112 RepID=A0A3M2I503_9GAMM|nr:hypothetical protein [Lysobacter pythonis]RMH93557.1 hypothetical protein EBB59_04765 [Lysobacter pythonis]
MRHPISVTALALTATFILAACDKPGEAPAEVVAPVEIPAPAPAPAPETADVPPPEPIPNTDPALDAGADQGVVTHFRANGVSPAWRAEVDGDTLKLDVPEHARTEPGFTTVKAERQAYAKGVEYSGKDGANAFTLTIDGKTRCDGAANESGETDREFVATLRYGKATYRGCADRL